MNGKVPSLRCSKVFFMFPACLLGRATILKLPQPRSKGGQVIIEHQSLCGQAPGAPRACCPLDSNLRYFAGMFLITLKTRADTQLQAEKPRFVYFPRNCIRPCTSTYSSHPVSGTPDAKYCLVVAFVDMTFYWLLLKNTDGSKALHQPGL